MSYSKTTWETGDTITAQLLNHAEDGIAANDAAIAAIPEGLQLYGPYYASASDPDAISAGQYGTVTCETLEDLNGVTVTYPESAAILLLYFLSTGTNATTKALLGEVDLPVYNDGTWSDALVTVINLEDSAKKIYPNIGFYSTVEFPAES